MLALITNFVPAISALIAVWLTASFTRRREIDTDWRKFKLTRYQEYISALSGVVGGRNTPELQIRYTDSVNNLLLVASEDVLNNLDDLLVEISYKNKFRSHQNERDILDKLIKSMREDLHKDAKISGNYKFRLCAPPPDSAP